MSTAVKKVLVVGATGSIGRQVIIEGNQAKLAMRALVRDRKQAELFPTGVEVAVGDLTESSSLGPALDGIDAVVFTHGANGRPPGPEAVDYGAVRNVLAALAGRQVRIALMTTVAVTDRKGAHDWKRRGERLVRASGMPYTIVRPGWFDANRPGQHRIVMLQGDRNQSGTPRDGVIARQQLARVLLWSVRSDAARGKTFELTSDDGPEQDDLDVVAEKLDRDIQGALDAVHDAPNMALSAEPDSVRNDLQHVRGRSPQH
ncbi:SDR family oxidoreductase [Pseudoduganella umbonata]|uniref:SDR family oxidoreductase n=1 Tax=Pseudoduganella umbonata TaxID=864828 RepID=A0A4P8HLH6_9BURK|nr:SDR family oxidoreductase [Pseudoduganella umbonata]MBB3221644.1 uncharacterized protein YbjT (DUF2867 family) [Pseudoduganella umbonata]QCP09128.1 SDR family oxidoreductase [Pseudoduganella umbonata]